MVNQKVTEKKSAKENQFVEKAFEILVDTLHRNLGLSKVEIRDTLEAIPTEKKKKVPMISLEEEPGEKEPEIKISPKDGFKSTVGTKNGMRTFTYSYPFSFEKTKDAEAAAKKIEKDLKKLEKGNEYLTVSVGYEEGKTQGEIKTTVWVIRINLTVNTPVETINMSETESEIMSGTPKKNE